MCVDYTDLNIAYPIYMYPLSNINRLINGSLGYRMLNFTNAYSGYNQFG